MCKYLYVDAIPHLCSFVCVENLFFVLEIVGNELENTLYATFNDG